ncbi:MAG TPA: triple tyrosine motif-containing protein, partial [Bacteroidia bacterium]|nr:triple tyrosine motif-containing protein [Bacteroidia bacterium]
IYYTSNNIKVPNSVQYVRIEFSNPYWGEPENLFCEYKLEGYNKQWIYLSPNESALEFSNLKSGEYKFTIRKQTGKIIQKQLLHFILKINITKQYGFG